MDKRLLASIALMSALVLPGAARAQSVDVDIYDGPFIGQDYYEDDDAALAPRRYYIAPEPEIDRTPAGRNGCGEFRYWNGERCADARDEPPDVR